MIVNKYTVYGLIIGALCSLLPGISGKQGKEPRLKLLANMVIVQDTGRCSNRCFHIHHWMWLGVVMLYTAYVTCLDSWSTQFILGAWISSTISEYVRYTDALTITQKCFPTCKVTKK